MSTADWPIDTTDPAALEAGAKPPECRTFADVQAILGRVPLNRIMAWPAPGFATAQDRRQLALEGIRCELRDGFLIVRKPLEGSDREPHLLTLGDYQARLSTFLPSACLPFPRLERRKSTIAKRVLIERIVSRVGE
jgi:hypothetical protein